MVDTSSYEVNANIAAAIQKVWPKKPMAAILLGTGLGALAERIQVEARIAYVDLPDMPISSVESHAGELVCGQLAGKDVIGFSGRLHCYEGHSIADVVVPVRVASILGAECLIMGSAVGGLNPEYQVGDIVVLEDFINLMGGNPLVGNNDERFGPRWPDMIEPYNQELIACVHQQALAQNIRLHQGVYAAVLGPMLETRAEYRMLQRLGADLVGMSTVPETIAAVHAGMRCLAFSIVTDRCLPDALEPVNIQKIIAAANSAEPVLSQLIISILENQ